MKARTVMDVAALARERRRALGWSQSRLADAIGVGRDWVVQFEKGKSTGEWGLVLRGLRALGLEFDLSVEEESAASGDLERILSRTMERPEQK